jgi:hypothetical protein
MSDAQPCYRVTWEGEVGVMRTEWLPGSVCGSAEAKAVTDEIRASGHGTVPILVDMRALARLERSGREHFASDHGGVSAIALLTASPVTRMMANFFIGMRRMPIPIQMFTDETASIAWLQEQP